MAFTRVLNLKEDAALLFSLIDQKIDVEGIRKDLEVALQESPTIKTVGLNNQLDITTSYLINDPRPLLILCRNSIVQWIKEPFEVV
jgi:hypothetical protein